MGVLWATTNAAASLKSDLNESPEEYEARRAARHAAEVADAPVVVEGGAK